MEREKEVELIESQTILETLEDFPQLEEAWLQSIQDFLRAQLAPLVPAKEIEKYLTPEAMKIWRMAFTHPSVDLDENYEELEYLGDKILKATWSSYIMKRLPGLKAKDYNNLDSVYMSKAKQPQYSSRLGLQHYVLIVGFQYAKSKILEDLFESFVGALFLVSEQVTEGLGYINVYNFLVHLFADLEIDPRAAEGHPKTVVIQIFRRFGKEYEVQEEVIQLEEHLIQVTVRMTPSIDALLADYGVQIANPILGQAKRYTKTGASYEAYKNALLTLESYGINSDWAELAKKTLDFFEPTLLPYYTAIQEKRTRQGWTRISFETSKTLNTQQENTLLLVGVHAKTGKRKILGSVTYPKSQDLAEIKMRLVDRWLATKD